MTYSARQPWCEANDVLWRSHSLRGGRHLPSKHWAGIGARGNLLSTSPPEVHPPLEGGQAQGRPAEPAGGQALLRRAGQRLAGIGMPALQSSEQCFLWAGGPSTALRVNKPAKGGQTPAQPTVSWARKDLLPNRGRGAGSLVVWQGGEWFLLRPPEASKPAAREVRREVSGLKSRNTGLSRLGRLCPSRSLGHYTTRCQEEAGKGQEIAGFLW